MDMAVGSSLRAKLIEQKIANLGMTLVDRMYNEFIEDLTKYDAIAGAVKYPLGSYFYGEGTAPAKISAKDFDEGVGKFEDSLEKSTYRPEQIIKANLLDPKLTQKELAQKITQLIACVTEGKVNVNESGAVITKYNTRLGNRANCPLSLVVLFAD